MTWVAAGTAAVSIVGGLIGGKKAKEAEAKAQRERQRIAKQMAAFEANRQAVINPYEDVTSNVDMINEMRDDLSNPFASLGVATQAAEIQMEQTDIALANTLDTLQASGASAGGATALAQAAKQSKKEVSANIEQQEAQNEQLKAQGEQQLQSMKVSEQQRLQNIAISEGQRVQTADAAGKEFVFQQQENRTNADLDRASGQQTQARQGVADANRAKAAAISGGLSAVGSLAGTAVGTFG